MRRSIPRSNKHILPASSRLGKGSFWVGEFVAMSTVAVGALCLYVLQYGCSTSIFNATTVCTYRARLNRGA